MRFCFGADDWDVFFAVKCLIPTVEGSLLFAVWGLIRSPPRVDRTGGFVMRNSKVKKNVNPPYILDFFRNYARNKGGGVVLDVDSEVANSLRAVFFRSKLIYTT